MRLLLILAFLGGCIHYSPSEEIALKFDDSIPEGIRDAAVSGSLTWNRCGAHVVAPEEATASTRRITVSGTLEVPGKAGMYRRQTGTIEIATVLIDFFSPDDELFLRYTTRIIGHEIGHAFGLKHVENDRSLMFHRTSADLNDLTQEDQNEWLRSTGLQCQP